MIDSINKVDRLIQYAHDIGLNGIAITDHEALCAHVKAQSYVNGKKKADPEGWKDFKLILGNEIYLCRDGLTKETFMSGIDKYYHFILLAKDFVGHQQLQELSSRAWKRSWVSFLRRVPTYYSDIEDIIGANPGHVVASTACIGGYLGQSILRYGANSAEKEEIQAEIADFLVWCSDTFGKENFYLEMQPSDSEEQIYVNEEIVKFSRAFDIPFIVTTDAHYLTLEDRKIHKAYLNSKEGDREVDDFYATTYVMKPEEIHGFMDERIGEKNTTLALENTNLIAASCEDYDLAAPLKIPYLPRREYNIDDFHLKILREYVNNGVPMMEKFFTSDWKSDIHLAMRLIEKYPFIYREDGKFKERMERLETELKILWDSSRKMNAQWSAYSLQVSDYINIYWTLGDSLVGPGRGSAVGEYINYLLDITQIDPTRELTPLMYWRYLNPERASVLDIDVDVESAKRDKCIKALQQVYGEERVVRVCTFGTEKARSAVQTACRALDVDVDIAHYLSSMIGSERGIQYSLDDVFYGNEDRGLVPHKQFVYEMTENYPEVWEVARGIEGLIKSVGQHAGGVIIVDEPFTNHNAIMCTAKGEFVSQFELHDSEAVGQIKIDLLATEATDKVRACLDLLVEYGYVEPELSLRETYEKVIGVYNLERTDPKMWEMVWDDKIISLFQMEKESGIKGIALTKPRSVEDLATLNSVIRLMAPEKGAEQPLDMWARYRQDITQWYAEMHAYGLSQDEIDFLANHRGIVNGICESQEGLMMLVQEPRLGSNSLAWADKARKALAKKIGKLFDECEKEFFENAKEKGCSDKLVHYVWDILLRVQRGYSFNKAHCLSYSIVGLQEMNLAFKYPPIFWNCANLIVDSGATDVDEDEEEVVLEDVEDEDDEDNDEPKKKKTETKTVNYGKISTAIGRMKQHNIEVTLPNINESRYGFSIDVEHNIIRYGIKGITRIGDALVKEIIANRPYTSLDDFMSKVKVNKTHIINLIKSGCFDELEGDRTTAMYNYLVSIADTKNRLTLQNMPGLIREGLIPQEMKFFEQLFNFNKYLKKNKDGIYYRLDDAAYEFYSMLYNVNILLVGDDGGYLIAQKEWDKIYKKAMEPMREYLKDPKIGMIDIVNEHAINVEIDKYARGSTSKWEMDSVGFYHGDHELADYYKAGMISIYPLAHFEELDEDPKVAYMVTNKKGVEIPIYELSYIAGTVISKDKIKHTVTLLTDEGVVNVKVWDAQFTKYDKQISMKMEDGKKKILERSWFTRGNKLLIIGFRRGDSFVPRTYRNGAFMSVPLAKIEDDGSIVYSRVGDED